MAEDRAWLVELMKPDGTALPSPKYVMMSYFRDSPWDLTCSLALALRLSRRVDAENVIRAIGSTYGNLKPALHVWE